jgi:multiple sugar transport system permease protein
VRGDYTLRIKGPAAFLVLALGALVWATPILWMIMASFMPYQHIIALDLSGSSFTLENYKTLLFTDAFPKYLRNSLVITISGTFLATALGSFSALYSLRNRRFSRYFLYWIVTSRIIPPTAFLLPSYLMFQRLGMLNSMTTLILIGFVLNYSLVFWLMRSVFDQIPREMEYSSLLDGASRLRAFFDTTIRYSAPGLLFVAMFAGLFIWNEFLLSAVLTIDSRAQPLTILLGQTLSLVKTDWGILFAIATIQVLPVMLFTGLLFLMFKWKKSNIIRISGGV